MLISASIHCLEKNRLSERDSLMAKSANRQPKAQRKLAGDLTAKKKSQGERLRQIQAAAYERGLRMAARAKAKADGLRDGMAEGMKAGNSKTAKR